jgi:phage gpG-like protein
MINKNSDKLNKSIRSKIPLSSVQKERVLYRIGSMLEYKIKQAIISKKLVDRGALLNSIRYTVEGNKVTLGSYGVIYAAIQEFGGRIKAKDKLLTIPIAPWAKYHRAKDFNLHYEPLSRPSSKLRGRLVNEAGETGFLLARYVDIKAKSFFKDTIESLRTQQKIVDIIQDEGSKND